MLASISPVSLAFQGVVTPKLEYSSTRAEAVTYPPVRDNLRTLLRAQVEADDELAIPTARPLLRRSFSIDVLQCPKCHGRLRVIAVITEREPVTRILAHVAMPTEAPPLARARDPSDGLDDDEAAAQLNLEWAERRR